jgi:hypothetical protein
MPGSAGLKAKGPLPRSARRKLRSSQRDPRRSQKRELLTTCVLDSDYEPANIHLLVFGEKMVGASTLRQGVKAATRQFGGESDGSLAAGLAYLPDSQVIQAYNGGK